MDDLNGKIKLGLFRISHKYCFVWRQHLKEAENLMAEHQESFEELAAFVAAYDPISLLSQLTLTFLFVPEDEFQGEASDVVTWQRRIEFLAGLVLVRPYPVEQTTAVDGVVLERVEKLLGRYFTAVDRKILSDARGSAESSDRKLILAEAKITSFHVRGDAYPHQYYAFAQDLYCPHEAWFRERLGFTIGEAVQLSKAIDRECGERFNRSLEHARMEAHRRADEMIAGLQATEDQRADLESRIGCALHFGQAENLLAFTLEELSEFSGVPVRTAECFLRRMSQQFGHRNPSFPTSFTDPAEAAWDYNTLNERPIVERDGKYWLFVGALLRSALFTTFYFDLLSDGSYRPTFEKARGNYLERKTAECLRRVFPPEMTLLNPLYPNGEEMADVMVLYDHKILLFQCKSKALTYRARIGSDFDVLRDDMRKAIADSFQQGIRAREYLQANKQARFTIGEKVFALDMDQVNGIYLVSVTSMPFQTLAARLANTNPVLGLFPQNEYPWSLSLRDLDVITQILSSPAQFLHYVLRRRKVEETPFQVHADEMDYLGFYLSHGMRFDMSDFEGMDDVGLSGFSDDIDRWVYEKFERGQNIDPPQSPVVEGFYDFLADVERTGDNYATDCALTLLDLRVGERKQFMEMVVQTKELSRQDKALHSFSVVLKGGKRGLSFLSFDAKAERAEVFRQASAFAMMKKYDSRCDEWSGFGWDIASTRTVDVAFFVSEPWAHDAQMDRLVKDKLRPGRRVGI